MVAGGGAAVVAGGGAAVVAGGGAAVVAGGGAAVVAGGGAAVVVGGGAAVVVGENVMSHLSTLHGVVVVRHSLTRIESALSVNFLFSQQVLKWLQNPLLKNVKLLHFGSSSQDFLHSAKSESRLPDEADRYCSPLDASHSCLLKKSFFK